MSNYYYLFTPKTCTSKLAAYGFLNKLFNDTSFIEHTDIVDVLDDGDVVVWLSDYRVGRLDTVLRESYNDAFIITCV